MNEACKDYFRPGGEGGKLAEDERLSFLGTFIMCSFRKSLVRILDSREKLIFDASLRQGKKKYT